ncbi:MAG: hypothetical protein AB9922_09710 [Bacteroidales bacterium]
MSFLICTNIGIGFKSTKKSDDMVKVLFLVAPLKIKADVENS